MTTVLKNRKLLIVLIIFLIIYSLISLVNHYLFRTYALDLGAYTNALYDYSHFQLNDSSVFKATPENLLADHFDIYLIIISPFALIFKGYTLLIFQILMFLVGGVGVYKYFNNKKIALLASIYFLSFFGGFSALAFDYHSNVIAACIVPWFFLNVKQKNIKSSIALLLLIVVAKENMALWTFFISFGLLLNYWKDVLLRKLLIFCSLLSVSYFILVLSFLMPLAANNSEYHHFHYSVLGQNSTEAIMHLFAHPIDSIKTLFINHINSAEGDYIKLELHILLILAGLPLLLKKPQFLLMLIPIYFQKLFHDNIFMWGVHAQYSIEFAPILAIGIFSVIESFKDSNKKLIVAYLIVLLNIGCTIRVMDNTVYFSNKTRIRLYKKSHYTRNYDVKLIHSKLNEIPKDAIISSQSSFIPHLAYRDNIYQFPIINDAEYIITSIYEASYPLKQHEFDERVLTIENSPEWNVIFNGEGMKIFKKVN